MQMQYLNNLFELDLKLSSTDHAQQGGINISYNLV